MDIEGVVGGGGRWGGSLCGRPGYTPFQTGKMMHPGQFHAVSSFSVTSGLIIQWSG